MNILLGRIGYILFLSFVIHDAQAAQARQLTTAAEQKEYLLSMYKPSQQRCRAGVWRDEQGNVRTDRKDVVSMGPEPELACMIAGFKDVIMWDTSKYEQESKKFKELLDAQGIQTVKSTYGGGSLLLHTPKGRANALLFVKEYVSAESTGPFYITGHLLGYSDQDISAFFDKQNRSDYEQQKQQAHAWLGKNKPGIEQWYAEYSKQQPAQEEKKEQEEGEAALQEKVATMVKEYTALHTQDPKKMPLSSMGLHYPEAMVLELVEQIMEHFKNKQELKAFSAYASGDLGLEYLVLRALALAGFAIDTINIVDVVYTQGTYAKNSAEFVSATGHHAFSGMEDPKKKDLVSFFRKQFMTSEVNVFATIYGHTFACLENPKLKSDLLMMVNFQYMSSPLAWKFQAREKGVKVKQPQLLDINFDTYSKINTNNHALIVDVKDKSVITWYMPKPDEKLLNLMTVFAYKITFAEKLSPEIIAEAQKLAVRVESGIAQLKDTDPNKSHLERQFKKLQATMAQKQQLQAQQ